MSNHDYKVLARKGYYAPKGLNGSLLLIATDLQRPELLDVCYLLSLKPDSLKAKPIVPGQLAPGHGT